MNSNKKLSTFPQSHQDFSEFYSCCCYCSEENPRVQTIVHNIPKQEKTFKSPLIKFSQTEVNRNLRFSIYSQKLWIGLISSEFVLFELYVYIDGAQVESLWQLSKRGSPCTLLCTATTINPLVHIWWIWTSCNLLRSSEWLWKMVNINS